MAREVIDHWTGKPRPVWTAESRITNRPDDPCQHCGSAEIINDCPQCGAPTCCWKCCDEDAKIRRTANLQNSG